MKLHTLNLSHSHAPTPHPHTTSSLPCLPFNPLLTSFHPTGVPLRLLVSIAFLSHLPSLVLLHSLALPSTLIFVQTSTLPPTHHLQRCGRVTNLAGATTPTDGAHCGVLSWCRGRSHFRPVPSKFVFFCGSGNDSILGRVVPAN